MTYITMFDAETGELWTGVVDGRARALAILPAPDGPGRAVELPAGKRDDRDRSGGGIDH
jgi:hypothetical protein